MKISEAIKTLKALEKKHGDVPLLWQSFSHSFPIELEYRKLQNAVVVNP